MKRIRDIQMAIGLFVLFININNVMAQRKDVNWDDSIRHYQQQYEAFGEIDKPTTQYMETALALAFACKEGQQYELGERIAARALVRGSFLADSCWQASSLFSLLAYFYEQRGDTIMPHHFHTKSQMLGIRNSIITQMPDSFEIFIKRVEYLVNMMDGSKGIFSHDHPAYLAFLNDYYWWVGQSDNILETVYLGEQILQMARDYHLTDQAEMCYGPYYWLLYAYPLYDEPDKAMALLPAAIDYYKRFPMNNITEADLYAQLGMGLMDGEYYKDALLFLEEAKKRAYQRNSKWEEEINQAIKRCKKQKE